MNMAEPRQPAKLVGMRSLPGVKRDGTVFEGNSYTDAVWTRWQRNRPRKMWGYNRISNNFSAINRGLIGYSQSGSLYVHGGSAENLQQQQFTITGAAGSLVDRTPATLAPDDNNLWQFAQMYDGGSNTSVLIAHAAPNLADIDNTTTGDVFIGDAYDSSVLTSIPSSAVSGGICVLYPYLFGFTSNGGVIWSVENTPSDFTGTGSGNARITGAKVVAGFPARAGAGVAPAGLFFALDALVRCTFAGGAAVFNFDRIAEGYSLLSSRGIIEDDGIFYWVGLDRFLVYNGVMQELPNDMNLNFFFDNLNFAQRQKVWATRNPRWGEICFFAPLFGATECNWMFVYNKREKTWYDTPINRVSGVYTNTFQFPIWFDDTVSDSGTTKLWMHEYGLDSVDGASVLAIQSYCETGDFSLTSMGVDTGGAGEDINLCVKRMEPDFITNGKDLTIELTGRKYAQSQDTVTKTYSCNDTTEYVDARFQSRAFRIKIESNVVGGDMQMGQPIMLIEQKDSRP